MSVGFNVSQHKEEKGGPRVQRGRNTIRSPLSQVLMLSLDTMCFFDFFFLD